jgi:hypothetical protein
MHDALVNSRLTLSSWNNAPGKASTYIHALARFWHPEQVTLMAVPNINYEFKTIMNKDFPFLWLNNLKPVEGTEHFLNLK